jgi:Flp pilus assembly protein TadG
MIQRVHEFLLRVRRRVVSKLVKPKLRDSDRGSATVEAVIGVPAFLLLLGLLIVGGRVAIAHQVVQSAASDAVRAASIARTQAAARTDATAAAQQSLANQQLDCLTTTVTLDTTGFAAPVGTPAQVRATVACDLNLSNLGIPGLPASLPITETMSSPLDTYRGR